MPDPEPPATGNLRDELAARALTLFSPQPAAMVDAQARYVATVAYRVADMMLEVRELDLPPSQADKRLATVPRTP